MSVLFLVAVRGRRILLKMNGLRRRRWMLGIEDRQKHKWLRGRGEGGLRRRGIVRVGRVQARRSRVYGRCLRLSFSLREPVEKAQEEDKEPASSQDGVQVSLNLVDGKPALHRLSTQELQEISSGDENDEADRGNRRRKIADHITPSPVPLSISSVPVEVQEPPNIVLFAPDSNNPAPNGDGSGNGLSDIIITSSGTGADPIVLFGPSTEAPHNLNRVDSTASTLAAN